MKFEYELSPEEEAELDSLLKETAELEDEIVDYDAIHDNILKKAREEGIAVFAKPRKKPAWKRALIYVSSAAAVIAVGLAALAVLKNGFGFLKNSGNQVAFNGETAPHSDVAVSTKAPDSGKDNTGSKQGSDPIVIDTNSPVLETESAAALTTPLPTVYPMRDGSVVGFVLLKPFTVAPVDSSELVPAALPSYMETSVADTELLAASLGKNEDGLLCYKCRVLEDDAVENDYGIATGVARYVAAPEGDITFLWHAAENCWLEIHLTGFGLEEAEQLLLSLPLCDMTAFEDAA